MQENVPEADNASSSDMECNEQELEDVRVCDTCGDAGYEEKLAPCCRCENGTEHIYCMPNNPKEVPRNWVCETCKQKEKESIRISNEEMAKASETVAEEKVKEDASSIEKTSLVRNSSDEGEEKQKEKVKQSIIPQKRKMDALTIPTPRQVKPLHSPPPSIKGKTSALNTLRAPKAPLPPLNIPKPANGKPGSPPRVSNAEGLQLQMPVDGRQIPRPISKEEKASPAVPANTLQKPDTPVNRIALEISKAKEVLQSRSFQERQRANAGNPALQSVADVQANPLLQAKTTAPLNSSKLRDVEKQDTENAKANQTEDVEVKNEKPKMATPGIGANGALPRTCHKCNGVGHLPQFCPNGAVKTLLGQILQSDPNSTQQASEHPPSSEPLSVQLPSPTGTPLVAPAASVQAPEASLQVQAQALLTSTQASQLPVASVEAATCVPASHTAQAPVPQLQLPVTAEPGVPFPTATVQVLQVPLQPPQVACPVQVPGTPVQVPLPPPVFTPIQLAHPSPNALWRGVLKIICSEGKETLLDGVKAYASNKADPKVLEASTSFQSILYLEELPRLRAWPKKFEITPPGDNDIALYLFPINDERLTRQYKELLDRMTSMDLVLKTKVDEVELLIYSSMIFDYELQYFGIEQKPYLWGVFRKPPVAKHMPTVEAQEADVPAVNVRAVVPGIETNKKENAGDETQLSSEQMDVPPGYAPQDLAEKESPPEYGPKDLADKEARAEEKLKQQDTGKPDHIERPRNERRGSYRDHRKESERYHRSRRDKDRSSRRLVRSSSRRSRSRSRSPRQKRYRHSHRHSRSRSRSRSRSPDRRRRDRSRRSRSRSPSWSRSRSYSRSPVRRPDKNRSRSHTRSASPRKHSTQHGRSRSRSPPRTSLESHKSPEVNPVYHNFLDLERTSDQECTVAVAEPPRRGGFDLELAPQADDLTLAVPQYRKAGGSWVKVEEIGKEDVNFALSSLCSSSSNTQANHS